MKLKKVKVKYLRKRSKSKATTDKADKALQNWYRYWFPDDKCEVCGQKAEVRHHHISKSKSNFLRYHKDNLIAICERCHSKIVFGDYSVVATYSVKRGKAWVDKMNKLKRVKRSAYSKKELEEIIVKYQCPIIALKSVDSEASF